MESSHSKISNKKIKHCKHKQKKKDKKSDLIFYQDKKVTEFLYQKDKKLTQVLSGLIYFIFLLQVNSWGQINIFANFFLQNKGIIKL